LGLVDANADARHLEDHGVVDGAIDGSSGGHRILEDPVPLAEHEIAGDDHGAALVPLGEERQQDLHLVAVLLDVPEVIADHGVVAVEDRELGFEAKVPLGAEQALGERVGRCEEHAVPTLDELVADGAHEVGLAAAGQSEREEIVAALNEPALAQRRQLLDDLGRNAGSIECGEGLVQGEVGVLELARDATTAALESLELDEVQVALERPGLAHGEPRDLLGMSRDSRELERAQQDGERRRRRYRGHAATSASSAS